MSPEKYGRFPLSLRDGRAGLLREGKTMQGTEWTEPGQGATKRATRYGDEDIARRRGMHLVPKTRECYEQHTGNCWHAEVSK